MLIILWLINGTTHWREKDGKNRERNNKEKDRRTKTNIDYTHKHRNISST